MKTVKFLIIMAIVAAYSWQSHGAEKHRYQYDVGFLDHGRFGVVEVTRTLGEAMRLARTLNQTKADHGAEHMVVVEEINEKGDIKP